MNIKLPRLSPKEPQKDFPEKFNTTMDELETRLNEMIETIDTSERQFHNIRRLIDASSEKIDDMKKRLDYFYGRLIEIFAIFVAIFSLIVVTGYNLTIAKGESILETTLNVLLYLVPLTLVLIIFVLLLNFLRKK